MNPIDFIANINIDLNAILSYLVSAELQDRLLAIKITFMAIIAILLGLLIFLMLKTHYLEWLFIQDAVQFITMRPFGAKKINRQWNKILGRLEAGSESEYKLAVMEANDLLDTSLKRMGYAGQTLEEKLGKLTSATLSNIQQLYEAHRLRNSIVHDPDYRLTLEETKKALDAYSQSFRDLQILAE